MTEFDVAIWGGGPAGTTVARCLALRGHRVCLFRRVPRLTEVSRGKWETLSPGAVELLRLHHPDVWPKIASFLIPCSAEVLWTGSQERSERGSVRQGTLVDRRLLDSVLLTSAAAVGISSRVVDPSLPPPSIGGNPAAWVLSSGQPELPDIRCRFLVDAAGRASALHGARFTLGPRTLALTAHIAGTRLERRNTCVEALADGWLWAGRGDGVAAAVTLFISPRTMRGWLRGERSTRFLETIQKSSLAATGNVPRMVSKLIARDATAVERTPLTVDGLLRTGDAALALDPLSGQGLQHALVSAAQVAIALHTMMARKESFVLAQEFCRARHAEAVHDHVLACREFYLSQDRFNGEFWRERMSENSLPLAAEAPSARIDTWIHERLILSHEAHWEDAPVIVGEFIESEHALCHPSLTRPIAYLEGRLVRAMLADLSGEVTGFTLLRRWAARAGLPLESGLRALRFFVRHGVLLPMGAKSATSR